MIIRIQVIGETLREESAIEMIHNAVAPIEKGTATSNEFNFQVVATTLNPQYYRAWKILKAIADILEIKP